VIPEELNAIYRGGLIIEEQNDIREQTRYFEELNRTVKYRSQVN
jgi:hypothetical protein